MSREYDNYLTEHISAVQKGWDWMRGHFVFDEDFQNWIRDRYPTNEPSPIDIYEITDLVLTHDASKTNPEEYFPYDDYFYLKKDNRSHAVVENFDRAFLFHLHRNPHHWQYWILTDDNKGDGEKLIEIPLRYIFEMICDWWSFSWRQGDLMTIFTWWDEHKDYIRMHKKSRQTVEKILNEMKKALKEENADEN